MWLSQTRRFTPHLPSGWKTYTQSGEGKKEAGGKKRRKFVLPTTASPHLSTTKYTPMPVCSRARGHTSREDGSIFANTELMPTSCLWFLSMGPPNVSSHARAGEGQRGAKGGQTWGVTNMNEWHSMKPVSKKSVSLPVMGRAHQRGGKMSPCPTPKRQQKNVRGLFSATAFCWESGDTYKARPGWGAGRTARISNEQN